MSPFAVLTVLLGLLTLAGVVYLLRTTQHGLASAAPVKLGFVTLGALTFYKLVAFVTLVPLPLATAATAHFELLEGAKEVDACGACHVMTPMVTDMVNPRSDSLAARHYKNNFIASEQCYHCHAGYGLTGALDAKLEGYRHLVRYTTGIYQEPIKKRGPFDSASCLSCHAGTAKFAAINSHAVAMSRLTRGQMSCVNCHGPAHPTRTERTPGSPAYQALMQEHAR